MLLFHCFILHERKASDDRLENINVRLSHVTGAILFSEEINNYIGFQESILSLY